MIKERVQGVGVYAVSTFQDPVDGRLIIIPKTHEEDNSKFESSAASAGEMIPLVACNFGGLSGAREDREPPIVALQREYLEEITVNGSGLHVPPEQFSNGLANIRPTQERGGRIIDFTVLGYEATLDAFQLFHMLQAEAVTVPLSQLVRFLEAEIIRPAWVDIYTQYLLKEGIIQEEHLPQLYIAAQRNYEKAHSY